MPEFDLDKKLDGCLNNVKLQWRGILGGNYENL